MRQHQKGKLKEVALPCQRTLNTNTEQQTELCQRWAKSCNFAPWLHLFCSLSLLPHPSGAGDEDITHSQLGKRSIYCNDFLKARSWHWGKNSHSTHRPHKDNSHVKNRDWRGGGGEGCRKKKNYIHLPRRFYNVFV